MGVWRTAASWGPCLENQMFSGRKLLTRFSAFSAAYPLQGWLPAVRFIPRKGYAVDKDPHGSQLFGIGEPKRFPSLQCLQI